MERVVLCSSSAPTRCSRKAIARLTAAGERPSLRPAAARLPSSTARTNTFIASRRSMRLPHPDVRLQARRLLLPRQPPPGAGPAFVRAAKECLPDSAYSQPAHHVVPHASSQPLLVLKANNRSPPWVSNRRLPSSPVLRRASAL